MPEKPVDNHDPTDRWRVMGSLLMIVVLVIALVLIVKFSNALSERSILGLFSLIFTLALLVLFTILRRPLGKKGGFSMDNPLIAIPASIFSGIVVYFLLRLFIQ